MARGLMVGIDPTKLTILIPRCRRVLIDARAGDLLAERATPAAAPAGTSSARGSRSLAD